MSKLMTFTILRDGVRCITEYYIFLNSVHEKINVSLDVHEEFIGLYEVDFIYCIFH